MRPELQAMPAVGQVAPTFTLPSQDGSQISLDSFRGKWVVLYFYPKDMTSGCTIEAHNFQRDQAKFDAENAVILGVSVDTPDSHKQFCTKEGLTFRLLADPEHKVVDAYGSLGNFGAMTIANRNTFLIDPQGKIVKVWTKVDPSVHSRRSAGRPCRTQEIEHSRINQRPRKRGRSLTAKNPNASPACEFMTTTCPALSRNSHEIHAALLDAFAQLAARYLHARRRLDRKQIVGHLLDSAARQPPAICARRRGRQLCRADYAQDAWVAAHGYAGQPWDTLLLWWEVEHEILAAVVDHSRGPAGSRLHVARRARHPALSHRGLHRASALASCPAHRSRCRN